ncbi:MAG: transposase [Bradymonadaceae bacterium]
MPFTRLRYHFVTSIKGRAPWILPDVEIVIHKAMCGRAKELGGVIMLINGVEDHQHIIAAVPPNITVSSFVGEVKS